MHDRAVAHSFSREVRKVISGKYLLAVPSDIQRGERCPMIVFLHGAWERGDEPEAIKIHSIGEMLNFQEDYRFILLAPLCPKGEYWPTDLVQSVIDEICDAYSVDEARIYLTGLSLGGSRTWDVAIDLPHRFAAIMPIAGRGNPIRTVRIAHVPCWVFHTSGDTSIPLCFAEEMVESLRKLNADVRLTVYESDSHNAWTETYRNPEVFAWLFAQRKRK